MFSKLNLERNHNVGSELIVEWRALTIVLLDKIKELINKKYESLNKKFNMSQILQGGTWLAGRRICFALRQNLIPPIKIRSDGTIF